jgi:tetratricopeptide (TPR) repeat protein
MKWAVGFIFCLLVPVTSVVASYDGGTVSPFNFGAGAHDLALGGAGIAVSDFATAPFWNASRLARAERFSMSGFHSRLYDSDVAYQYAGLVMPTLDFGVLGAGVFRLGIDGIEKRDAGNLLLGEIEDNRLGFYLAYGRTISGYDVGLALTMEHHSLDNYSANSSPGLNLSIGRRIVPRFERLRHITIALNGRNLVRPSFKLDYESISYPLEATAGISVGLAPNPNWDQLVTVSASLTNIDWVDPRLAVGIEYSFRELLHLCGGMRDGRFSFGMGLGYKAIKFDYALVDRDLGSLHMFSITTAFGKPLAEKREIRAKQREAEFNNLMSKSLATRNHEMISELVQSGKELLEAGDLVEASSHFDRALFLARGSNIDTTHIYDLAVEAQRRLDDLTRQQRFKQHMDSAQAKYDAGDYLTAEYFASLAMVEKPNSTVAANLAQQASTAMDRSMSREETIQSRLRAADSLLSYGQAGQALAIIGDLSELAPLDNRVERARVKAEFEQWRAIASAAYSGEDFEAAVAALDSALALFPGHQWCLDLRNRITSRIDRPSDETSMVGTDTREPLSAELQKEIDFVYMTAQELFKKGDLIQAIGHWEKVERLAPNYLSVRKYLVNAYKFVGVESYGKNKLQEAVVVWKKAIQLDPDNSEVRNFITRTETEIRKLKELSYDQQ